MHTHTHTHRPEWMNKTKRLNGSHHSKPHNPRHTHITQMSFVLSENRRIVHEKCVFACSCVDDQWAIIAQLYSLFFSPSICLPMRLKKTCRIVKIMWNKFTKTNTQSVETSLNFMLKFDANHVAIACIGFSVF